MVVQSSGKLIVFSAPSGAGKTTIANMVLQRVPNLRFSVSATTRKQRDGEQNGVNYYFLDKATFEHKIEQGGFIEYEFFFGNYYGTLLDATESALASGNHLLLDVDVKGALNVRKLFGKQALLLFIQPPSMEVLIERLQGRGSEDETALQERLERARFEMSFAEQFDKVIINNDLLVAVSEVETAITTFLSTTL